MRKVNLGLIGAGSIAEALLKGILSCGLFSPEEIYAINKKDDKRLDFFRENYRVNITRDYEFITTKSDVLVIAIKPHDMESLLDKISKFICEDHVIISVVAGITTSFIEEKLAKRAQVIRVMPNTSCQVNESATAIAKGRFTKKQAVNIAEEIFSSVGKVIFVNEKAIDAVTGLSGSGPAYVYLMLEAMIEAGVKEGLTRNVSQELALQTVFGAAKMAIEAKEPLCNLIKRVTSPGGTTMAGIKSLERMGFTNCIIEAVKKATQRSQEMAR
jgi:pyrroline-5-carboxylate reductase